MSLRVKMILWFVLIAVMVGAMGAVAVNRQKAAAEVLAMKDAEHVVASLGAAITFEVDPQTHPALYKNPQALQGYIELLHNVYHRDLEIVDLNKIIIADVIKKDIGTLLTHDTNNEVGQTMKDGIIRSFKEISEEYPEGIKQVVAPLKNAKGEIIGALIFEYTPIIKELTRLTQSTIQQIIIATIICLLLAIILGYLLSENILRPIQRLKNTALEIVNGNISAQAPIASKDEIGELATAFNTMTSNLAQSNQRLQAEITERRRTSEERDQVVGLLDTMAVLVMVLDQEGRIIRFNRACQQAVGYSQAELQDRPFWETVIAPEDASRTKAMFLEMVNGRIPPVFEVYFATKGGGSALFSWYYALLPGETDNGTCIIGAGLDITERGQAHEALEHANRQLQALVQAADKRNSVMALVNNMSEMLQTCKTSEEAFVAISHFIPKFFPDDAGALYIIRNSKNLLSAVTVWGQPPPPEEWFPPDDCWAARSGRVHWVDDPASALLCKHVTPTDPAAPAYFCVPLLAQGESRGILHIRFLSCTNGGREAKEVEAKQRLAVAIAENLALSLANLKLRETLQNQAIRDPLTGLYNRRYLEETMDREFHRSMRLKAPLGVVMMDLDRFKAFNDTFGHGAGDALLSALAHVVTAGIRSEDIACRYGGEEFLLVMPGMALETIRERAENLRQAVKALKIKYQGRFLKSTTVSLGLAMFPEHGHTPEEVITAADAALYRAKQAGRDRVEIAAASPPEPSAS